MRFLNRVFGSLTEGSRAHDRRLAGRRRSAIACEALEGRALLSIPGVSLNYTTIQITAPKASGNVVAIAPDAAKPGFIKVSVNGLSEDFAASQVTGVTYKGGASGGDRFVNDTKLNEFVKVYNGNNSVTGGSSAYNVIYLYGNNNTYTAKPYSTNNVFENSTTDTIYAGTGAKITVTVYPPWFPVS